MISVLRKTKECTIFHKLVLHIVVCINRNSVYTIFHILTHSACIQGQIRQFSLKPFYQCEDISIYFHYPDFHSCIQIIGPRPQLQVFTPAQNVLPSNCQSLAPIHFTKSYLHQLLIKPTGNEDL